jgi:glycosyltransferase involved in cell wall biosynthesis
MVSVVHFAFLDSTGGSGRSAYRIHGNLRGLGVQSRMIVARKASQDPDVRIINQESRLLRKLDRWGLKLSNALSLQDVFVPSSHLLYRDSWIRQADIIQMFNTWRGFLSFAALPSLSKNRPVVWRLSDQWLFTGHCVYDYGCERWKTGCGSCPQVDGERALRRDTSAIMWRLKRWIYKRSNLVIVAPSTWIARLASESPLIGHFPIHHIPNGIDTTIYGPIPKSRARSLLGIPPDSKVVLFCSDHLHAGRKGGHLLEQALRQISDIQQGTLVLLGKDQEYQAPAIPGWTILNIGYIADDQRLAAAYSAADISAIPSLADNLPNTALESLACGTPVVAFDVGGMSDVVKHLHTGYLARSQDPIDLAQGIRQLLTDNDLRKRLSYDARILIENWHRQEQEAQAFKDLYESLRP